jgi:hypothetical protein
MRTKRTSILTENLSDAPVFAGDGIAQINPATTDVSAKSSNQPHGFAARV